ncbi:hypothetical protein P12024L_48 [Nonlabens phage P12024L]|uniref:Uncharacterized protein n=2 Tax=Inhavirus TaxID=1982244 RepID=I6RTE7_9CAUD|nr:hypothetical protein B617_gp47 [Nonlabens phage P12024S]YP_006560447.1 hypothetical protein B618_gp48 [Nonlabens phage P12024L]AFM54708.1 hypothetical protein P12024S_47 [Nonlabens phage P12024S]AFM54768.1 hypothetical protein P12024L_48 [Nonlabens phage P12024L]
MKVFYDNDKRNISIEGVGVYFPNSTLEAIIEDGKVSVRNKNSLINIFHLAHTDIEKEDGSSSGSDINETVTYLNDEFNKSQPSGTEEFTGVLTTQVVNDDRIKAADIISVMPVTDVLVKEALIVTKVIDGSFIVIRFTIGSGIHVLTTALPFRWKVL